MRSEFFRRSRALAAAILAISFTQPSVAEPTHGIAMYGDPALPPDFVSLPYANPDAPKGGRVVTGNVGGYDSLNPFTVKGTPPWQLRYLTHETLMGRSYDEPFTLYGLLAESVEAGPNREWVEFTLRPEARFSDGSPVTVEDVIWSYQTLGSKGHGRYRGVWSKIERIEATGPRSVRITFNAADRELALVAGLRPILKKSQWEGKDFANAGIEEIPIGSAPYVIESFEPGRNVVLRRNPDYWGKDLPLRRGTANFDEIRIEFYGDDTVLKEAFKGGAISYVREFNAEKWEAQYDFPAVINGDIVKSEIPHQKPSGMTGFVFNTRRAPLDDIRVRDALDPCVQFRIHQRQTDRRAAATHHLLFLEFRTGYATGPGRGSREEVAYPFRRRPVCRGADGLRLAPGRWQRPQPRQSAQGARASGRGRLAGG